MSGQIWILALSLFIPALTSLALVHYYYDTIVSIDTIVITANVCLLVFRAVHR